MDHSKGLSALNYFSVFFAPFIVPIIIYFISADAEVKRHAIRALLSHVIPVILGIVLVVILFIVGIFSSQVNGDILFTTWILLILGYGLLYLIVIIWNVVQGIKVLRS
ncbi:DUF4870 domain-containing protein [Lysinibacillus sp. KU-BSD001]|uniref:DUF4870 domain-containing protein n=1 Tax=Lysinibacillus sp. KU-BSD001 TaxID=3141328 RepID=UPI0036E7AC96